MFGEELGSSSTHQGKRKTTKTSEHQSGKEFVRLPAFLALEATPLSLFMSIRF